MSRSRHKKERGIGLIEMITSIGIIIVLSALVVANTRVGDRRQQLRDGAGEFVTLVKSAESAAAGSRLVGSPAAPRKAYGVCITSSRLAQPNRCGQPTSVSGASSDADSYQLYARDDCTSAGCPAPSAGSANIVILETHVLPRGVRFLPRNVNNPRGFYVDYLPPAPSMLVTGSGLGTSYFVDVQFPDRTYLKTVELRPQAGAIYVQ